MQINEAEASHFGCLVEDPRSHQVLHFAEKPETFVSDLASCGVYTFSPGVFAALEEVAAKLNAKEVDILGQSPVRAALPPHALTQGCQRTASGEVIISLERDLFTELVMRNEMFLFQTMDFFIQIKLARCAALPPLPARSLTAGQRDHALPGGGAARVQEEERPHPRQAWRRQDGAHHRRRRRHRSDRLCASHGKGTRTLPSRSDRTHRSDRTYLLEPTSRSALEPA